jgi:hypothetical protein
LGRQSASKFGGFARSVLAKGLIRKLVKFPRFYVTLDLAIPCGCIKLSEPLPKLCEFLSRETGDSLLDGFEVTHRRIDTTFFFRELTPIPYPGVHAYSGDESAFDHINLRGTPFELQREPSYHLSRII